MAKRWPTSTARTADRSGRCWRRRGTVAARCNFSSWVDLEAWRRGRFATRIAGRRVHERPVADAPCRGRSLDRCLPSRSHRVGVKRWALAYGTASHNTTLEARSRLPSVAGSRGDGRPSPAVCRSATWRAVAGSRAVPAITGAARRWVTPSAEPPTGGVNDDAGVGARDTPRRGWAARTPASRRGSPPATGAWRPPRAGSEPPGTRRSVGS